MHRLHFPGCILQDPHPSFQDAAGPRLRDVLEIDAEYVYRFVVLRFQGEGVESAIHERGGGKGDRAGNLYLTCGQKGGGLFFRSVEYGFCGRVLVGYVFFDDDFCEDREEKFVGEGEDVGVGCHCVV